MTWSIPRGIIPNLMTPMTRDHEIDVATLRKLTEFHIRQESTGSLCVGVHLADSHNLSLEERKLIAEVIVGQTAGRKATLVSVAAPSLDQSLELAEHARRIGADALISVPPYHWDLTQEDLYDHYVTLAETVPMPLVGYHLPSWQKGVGFSPELVMRLAGRLPNFVGLKDASFSLAYHCELRALMARQRPDFEISLSLEWLVPSFPLGAYSAHSGISAFVPNLTNALYRAMADHDLPRARALFIEFGRVWSVIYRGFPNSIKAAMELVGRPIGPSRPPLPQLTPAVVEQVRRDLDALGVLEREPKGWGE